MKIHWNLKSRQGRTLGGNAMIFIFLCLSGVVMALPMVYIISSAFKPLDELFMFPPRFFVVNPTLDNFKNLTALLGSSSVPISRYFLNTLFITFATTVAHILVASLAAYVLEKRKFPGQKIIFSTIVLSLMFSGSVTAVPNYIILSRLGWINTYWAVIVPQVGSTLGLYLMKQFMCTVPDSLLESAKMDGAGELTIFWRIVMPIVKPAWLTLIIMLFQSIWGITGSGVLFDEELKPLNYAIGQIISGGISRTGVGSAVTFLMMLVPLSVFLITQSNIIETMATSGMKD